MNITNVATYLTERKRFNFQSHSIEGLGFNLIPLTDDMVQNFKIDNEPYDDMLVYAAKHGVSIGRDRVCNDEEMSAELNDMWSLEQFDECEPSLIHQVGLKVCEISGLTEFAEAEKIKVGLHQLPSDTVIDNLNQESLDQDSLNVA